MLGKLKVPGFWGCAPNTGFTSSQIAVNPGTLGISVMNKLGTLPFLA